MYQQPLSDTDWLRQCCPQATPQDIEKFIERVGIKVDSAHPPVDILARARMEALQALGY